MKTTQAPGSRSATPAPSRHRPALHPGPGPDSKADVQGEKHGYFPIFFFFPEGDSPCRSTPGTRVSWLSSTSIPCPPRSLAPVARRCPRWRCHRCPSQAQCQLRGTPWHASTSILIQRFLKRGCPSSKPTSKFTLARGNLLSPQLLHPDSSSTFPQQRLRTPPSSVLPPLAPSSASPSARSPSRGGAEISASTVPQRDPPWARLP